MQVTDIHTVSPAEPEGANSIASKNASVKNEAEIMKEDKVKSDGGIKKTAADGAFPDDKVSGAGWLTVSVVWGWQSVQQPLNCCQNKVLDINYLVSQTLVIED